MITLSRYQRLTVLSSIALATFWTGCKPAEESSPAPKPSAPSEADSEQKKSASIDEAIAKGNLDEVRAFLKADPASANKGAHPKLPPLLQAVMRNKSEIALALIQAGADVNAADSSGRSALHLAVERGNPGTIAALMAAKANPNVRDQTGWTPLHHAGAKNQIDCIRALLAGGADPMTLSERGGTPLHEAAASGSVETIQVLLDAGVDPTVVSKTGQTALSIAKERGDAAVVKIISDAAEAK